MRYEITSKINLLNMHDTLVVTKNIHYSHDDGKPFYRNQKMGSVMLFGEELIGYTVVQSGSKKELCYDLNDCNSLLTLLDCFLCNNLKGRVMFEIKGYMSVWGEVKTKSTRNLLLTLGTQQLYLTPFEARCAERCVKNVLMSLARE